MYNALLIMENVVHAIIESLREHTSVSGHWSLSLPLGGKHNIVSTINIQCHSLEYWYHVVFELRL